MCVSPFCSNRGRDTAAPREKSNKHTAIGIVHLSLPPTVPTS